MMISTDSATTSAYEPVNTALDHGLVKIRATVNIGSNPNLITEPQGSIESDQYGMGREYVDDRQTSLCVVPIDR